MAERDLAQIEDWLLSSWSSKQILHAPYVHRALHWARLGRLCIAIKAMSSNGVADPEDELVQAEILKRHPKGSVLLDADLPDLTPAITVTDHLVLKALKAFPKDSSLGGFQLRAQHLLDAVSGFTAPVSQDCLHQLTCLVNFLLSGKAPVSWPLGYVVHRSLLCIRKMEVFVLLLCAKPSDVWLVVFVASLFMMICLTCFCHTVKLINYT